MSLKDGFPSTVSNSAPGDPSSPSLQTKSGHLVLFPILRWWKVYQVEDECDSISE